MGLRLLVGGPYLEGESEAVPIENRIIPLDELLPDGRNPRRHGPENIKRLVSRIQAVGFTSPVLVDEKTRILAAGHRRRLALHWMREHSFAEPDGIEPGWGVPCRVGSWTELQALQVLTGDNGGLDELEYDNEALAALLADLQQQGALEGAGYSDEALDRLIGELAAGSAAGAGESGLLDGCDPDAIPEQVETRCQRGDLWALGEHRVIVDDCRTWGVLNALMQGEKANVVVTSPPYASQRKYDEESGFRPIPPDEYGEWFDAVQIGVRKILADDGSYFLNIKEHCEDGQRHLYVKDLTLQHVREWGWRFVDEFCWRDTKNGVPGGWPNRFKDAWEPVFHFTRQAAIKFHPLANGTSSEAVFEYSAQTAKTKTGSGLLGVKATEEHAGIARPSNVIEVAAASTGEHAAAYPVALPEFFLNAFSDPGDLVFDPFLGSGTTLIAAEKTGRCARGCEISPRYADVILARYEKATGRTAELLQRHQPELREAA